MKLTLILLTVACAWAGDVTLTIAGLRVTPERWDKQANLTKLEHYTREAAAKGAGAAPGSSASFLEGLGNRATQGIHRLLYWIGRAEHR